MFAIIFISDLFLRIYAKGIDSIPTSYTLYVWYVQIRTFFGNDLLLFREFETA